MGKNVIISTLPNISQNYLPKVNTSNIFANSLVYDDGSSVLINTTTASAFKLDVNGTARTGALTLTGALSGTSATFSGFVGVNGSPATAFPLEAYINSATAYTTSSRGNVLRVYNTNTGANIFAGIELGGAGSANDGLAGINATVTGNGSAALTFYTRDANTFSEKFRIASTGAATFSSSVTAGGIISTSGTGLNSSVRIANTTATTGVDWHLYSLNNGNFGLYNNTGSSYAFVATSGGNVGIGTTSPNKGGVNKALTLNAATSTNASYELSVNDVLQGSLYTNISDTSVRLANFNSGDIVLVTGATSTPRMTITSGGRVGIGTTTINSETLTINHTTGGSSALYVYTTGVATGQSYGLTVLAGTNSSDRSFAVFNQGGSTEYLKVRGDGIIFAPPIYNNTTSSAANITVFGDGSMFRSTASSIRFKENILDWNANGLSTILALKPKTFTYKQDYYKHPEKVMLGLIAEEVAEVCPYLADYENEDGSGKVENVRYANIVVPLIKAIQELKAELDTLKNK